MPCWTVAVATGQICVDRAAGSYTSRSSTPSTAPRSCPRTPPSVRGVQDGEVFLSSAPFQHSRHSASSGRVDIRSAQAPAVPHTSLLSGAVGFVDAIGAEVQCGGDRPAYMLPRCAALMPSVLSWIFSSATLSGHGPEIVPAFSFFRHLMLCLQIHLLELPQLRRDCLRHPAESAWAGNGQDKSANHHGRSADETRYLQTRHGAPSAPGLVAFGGGTAPAKTPPRAVCGKRPAGVARTANRTRQP